MPCGPECACAGIDGVECLSVVDPERFSYFASWCASGDPVKRAHVLGRSRIGAGVVAPPAPAPDVVVPAAQPQAMLAGDIVESAAKLFGADRVAKWIASKTGQPCNCEARRIALNALDAKLRAYLGRKA